MTGDMTGGRACGMTVGRVGAADAGAVAPEGGQHGNGCAAIGSYRDGQGRSGHG